jgi:hypothetical protein
LFIIAADQNVEKELRAMQAELTVHGTRSHFH